ADLEQRVLQQPFLEHLLGEPEVAGALVALGWQKLRQPNPWLLGPLLLAASVSLGFDLHIGLPAGSSGVGQWLIGSALGCHFNRSFFRSAPAFVSRTLVCTLWMMFAAALAAELLGWLTTLDHQSLMLGMMPGGIAELSLTAEALQLSVPLVTALQVLRLLLVLFLAEPCFRYWRKRAG
ncbi:AbrB family transcriptional regulator, partial [Pseudomonas aeruginosa]|uniref:AbrB family transcriptional regulator n=1 Tax=Pseudomonas aeruginosa TaxID=287 RepID=UPI0020C8C31D